MKCPVCKYLNMAEEASRHTNAVTVAFAESLRGKIKENMSRLCDVHHPEKGMPTDIEKAHKALKKAHNGDYVPLDMIWGKIVWTPRAERIG